MLDQAVLCCVFVGGFTSASVWSLVRGSMSERSCLSRFVENAGLSMGHPPQLLTTIPNSSRESLGFWSLLDIIYLYLTAEKEHFLHRLSANNLKNTWKKCQYFYVCALTGNQKISSDFNFADYLVSLCFSLIIWFGRWFLCVTLPVLDLIFLHKMMDSTALSIFFGSYQRAISMKAKRKSKIVIIREFSSLRENEESEWVQDFMDTVRKFSRYDTSFYH